MSVVVNYPVQIKRYVVELRRDRAEIVLEGVEGPIAHKANHTSNDLQRVARITFSDENRREGQDFINRGGFLQMDRPLAMLPAILDLLRHEKSLFLQEDGTLSTSLRSA